MTIPTAHGDRLADVARASASLTPDQQRRIIEEYTQGYWYAAGRLDERTSDHGGHQLPHLFAIERAWGRLEYVSEGTCVFRSMIEAWRRFDQRENVREWNRGVE